MTCRVSVHHLSSFLKLWLKFWKDISGEHVYQNNFSDGNIVIFSSSINLQMFLCSYSVTWWQPDKEFFMLLYYKSTANFLRNHSAIRFIHIFYSIFFHEVGRFLHLTVKTQTLLYKKKPIVSHFEHSSK